MKPKNHKTKLRNDRTTKAFKLPAGAGVFLSLMVLVFSGIFMARTIDLTTADLGRHIVNGRIFLEQLTLVKTNYYSYTEPGLSVVNHHWGTGVIYELIYKMAGFNGLSVFNILCFIATVFVFFRIAVRKSDSVTAFFMTMIMLPLIASRAEVRPEIISYLFAGIAYSILENFHDGVISFRKTWILPVIMVFWVNLHIFFVMGLVILGAYFANGLIRRNRLKIKQYGVLLTISILLCLINPSGLNGLIEPFLILREYGYRIAENQSLFFMQGMFPGMIQYIHFEIMAVLAVAIVLLNLFVSRKLIHHDTPGVALLLLFALMSMAMIRVMPLFGFFFIPVISGSVQSFQNRLPSQKSRTLSSWLLLSVALIVAFVFIFTRNQYYSAVTERTGLGWNRTADGSAAFFKENNLKGPVFNNYDIGGYLIFHLFPSERVFVDNRPEAYSVGFFKEIYEPMQASEERWKEIDQHYRFNVIFFNRLDYSQNAQPFLIRRIADPAWVPVFVDDRTIILVRKNDQNEPVIRQFGLPASMFISEPSE